MTGLEAIPKIAELIASLLRKAGDKETMTLAKQIQTYQTIIEESFETKLKEKDAELEKRDTEITRMKKVIEEFEAKIKALELKLQNRNVETCEPVMLVQKLGRDD
jgi:Na+/phosphate symporter